MTPIFDTVTIPENTAAFIKLGADINYRDENGISPLSTAFSEYNSWIGNKHAGEYHPKVVKVIDLLLEAGSNFNKGMLQNDPQTELCKLVKAPKMLNKILNKEGVKEAPEFNLTYHKWSAVFEAPYLGETESLKTLIDSNTNVNQQLESVHYESKSFIGATPLNVAKNSKIKTLLLSAGVKLGEQNEYAIYLETRGEKEPVQQIIKEIKQVTESEADKIWQTVKKKLMKSSKTLVVNLFCIYPYF